LFTFVEFYSLPRYYQDASKRVALKGVIYAAF
jgi:hypothetical protein